MPSKKSTGKSLKSKKKPIARETEDVDDVEETVDEPDVDELSATSSEDEVDDVIEAEEPDEVSLGTSDVVEDPSSCVYRVKGKKTAELIDNEVDDLEIFGDEPTVEGDVAPEDRITKAIMTKYERVRVLGDRRAQLTRGAKPMVKNTEGLTIREIADQEMKNGVIPFIIIRRLPSGRREMWKVSELKIGN